MIKKLKITQPLWSARRQGHPSEVGRLSIGAHNSNTADATVGQQYNPHYAKENKTFLQNRVARCDVIVRRMAAKRSIVKYILCLKSILNDKFFSNRQLKRKAVGLGMQLKEY